MGLGLRLLLPAKFIETFPVLEYKFDDCSIVLFVNLLRHTVEVDRKYFITAQIFLVRVQGSFVVLEREIRRIEFEELRGEGLVLSGIFLAFGNGVGAIQED